jgi:acetylornithine deacetylase/succinyl-diaminopimelate desuccinylase-like protein
MHKENGMSKEKTITLSQLIEKNKSQLQKDYFTFLSYPSVSSEPEYKNEVLACADWLVSYLKEMQFDVTLWPTMGHPTIFASYLHAGSDKPTLLIYNHYDVQPVDPVEAWRFTPFQPTIDGDSVYARGAQDNKGQCFYVLQALKMLMERDGSLPINVKLCIDGEEEIGSPGLSTLLSNKQNELRADFLAIVDTGLQDAAIPAITLGARGLVAMDVELTASHGDLHSGTNGGIAFNPNHALIEILASLRNKEGRVTIPGFYDQVVELSKEERASLSLEFDPTHFTKETGIVPTGGEQAYAPLERTWIRPTLEVNGIIGGYSGSGFKTVIPSKASAKISCRLVPDQDPAAMGKLVADHLKKLALEKGMIMSVHIHPGSGRAIRANLSSKIVHASAKAFEEVFSLPCEYIFAGGSIPIAPALAEASQSDIVFLGLGLSTDQIHAPNENFSMARIEKGIKIMARLLELLAS